MQAIMDYKTISKPENIPDDIDAEVLFGLYPKNSLSVKFCGMHKRNSYRDVLEVENNQGKLLLHLGRNSLYNSLPEYLFHSIDRFNNIPEREKKQKFAEECLKQEQEKEQAYRFFYPIDTFLFYLRLQVREQLSKYVESNIVIQNIILDRLTKEQKKNRFIRRTAPYIASCKSIRGNRTLITLLLRKVFLDEGIIVNIHKKRTEFTDISPRYPESTGSELGELFVGNTFSDSIVTYLVSYWPDDECNSDFLSFVDELEVYRQFVQDYFLSVDSILKFDVSRDASPLRISDTTIYNYLNFNTNI